MHTPRPWRRLSPDLFRFATTELYDLRVAIMCVFDDSAVLQPALSCEAVRSGLAGLGWDEAVDDAQLDQALGMLTGWGLLEASQNHAARYATPEEFERRNLQWSLTTPGQAAIGGVLHALDALRQVAGLQPAVIEAIADGLADLHDLAGDPLTEPGRIATRLAEVESHLTSLVTSVRQFNTQLQRLMRDDATSDEVFGEVKRRTVVYLKEYIDGVERPTRRVQAGIERLAALGVEAVFERALAGANLAPMPGADPGVAWRAERARRWDALRAWFAPDPGAAATGTAGAQAQPKITALVELAREAILQLLRVLERRWESRRRSASVAEDFRALAGFFALAAGEPDAHRIEGLERRRRGIEAEVASAPDGVEFLEARRGWDRARVLFDEVEVRLRAVEARRAEAEQAVRQAQTALMQVATRHALPTDPAAIAVCEQYLGSFESAAGIWSRRRRAAAQAAEALARSESDRRRAEGELNAARQRRSRAEQDHREVVVRLETLEANVGTAYRDVVARIEAARSERRDLEGRQRQLGDERARLERQIGGLEQQVAEAARRRSEAEGVRDTAHRQFLAVVADGYGEDAGAELSFDGVDTATGILDSARAVAARFPNLDAAEAAVTRAQASVLEGYHTAGQTLRGRVDLSLEQAETGFWLLRASTDGIRSRVAQLVRRMTDQLAVAAEELTEEERRLFDETLTGSLRAAVGDRIRQANGLSRRR
jgi:hypothetical protein